MELPEGIIPYDPPFTLGHENTGHVAALGAGVTGWHEGDAVAIYGPWGCGRCRACRLSFENYCEHTSEVRGAGGGLGLDGGMAEYVLVPSARLLVPLGDLDPVEAAPLGDAALTPYHAIARSRAALVPGTTALVIGVGGLGHMAIQILRALTPARRRDRREPGEGRAGARGRCRRRVGRDRRCRRANCALPPTGPARSWSSTSSATMRRSRPRRSRSGSAVTSRSSGWDLGRWPSISRPCRSKRRCRPPTGGPWSSSRRSSRSRRGPAPRPRPAVRTR